MSRTAVPVVGMNAIEENVATYDSADPDATSDPTEAVGAAPSSRQRTELVSTTITA